MRDFEPLQGLTLVISLIALLIEIFIVMPKGKKWLLEIPSLLLILDYIGFYGVMLAISPYNATDFFIWSQVLRLHSVMTLAIMALYRTSTAKNPTPDSVKLSNIRNGFANARDNLANARDDTANARDIRLEERDKHG